MTYEELLCARIAASGSHLCVGLDPRPELTPEGNTEAFIFRVVSETAPFAAAFKPNSAYFEAMGSKGFKILERLRARIPPQIPLILDAKRSDIPETQVFYARAAYDVIGADAVTVNPLMGFDSVEPFLQDAEKGVYILALTSNPGARDILLPEAGPAPVFERILAMAEQARGKPGSLGFVAGLTLLNPELLTRIPDRPLLIPGFGAQGGQLSALLAEPRFAPILVNASRSILYGEGGPGMIRDRARATKEAISHVLR